MEEVVAKAKIKKVGYIYGCVIDQVWGQYGWILAKFFFVKFSQGKKKKQTKNKANKFIISHLDPTYLVNCLL